MKIYNKDGEHVKTVPKKFNILTTEEILSLITTKGKRLSIKERADMTYSLWLATRDVKIRRFISENNLKPKSTEERINRDLSVDYCITHGKIAFKCSKEDFNSLSKYYTCETKYCNV